LIEHIEPILPELEICEPPLLEEIPDDPPEEDELVELVELELEDPDPPLLDVVDVQTGSGTPRLAPHIPDKQHSIICPEQSCVAFVVGHIGVMPLQHNLTPLAQYAFPGLISQNPLELEDPPLLDDEDDELDEPDEPELEVGKPPLLDERVQAIVGSPGFNKLILRHDTCSK
jgi:hypothetical protein